MLLTREEVEHIARLARLDLSEAEITLYQEQLSAILDYARRLQSVDTGDIAPTASVLPPRSVLRADEPGATLSLEELFANTLAEENRQFKVPPVLENGA